eukprot:g3000.t1
MVSWWNDAKLVLVLYVVAVTYFLDTEGQMRKWMTDATDPENVKYTFTSVGFWVTIFVLSLEHALYAYLWKKPLKFRKHCVDMCGDTKGHEGVIEKTLCQKNAKIVRKIRGMGDKPWEFVHVLLVLNKIAQVLAFLGWFGSVERHAYVLASGGEIPTCSFFGTECWNSDTILLPYMHILPKAIMTATKYQISLALPMLIVGQILNLSVYRAIGKEGVYYGYKLGIHIPWASGFPFSVLRHPQYVGATMSWWAIIIMLAGAPSIVGSGLFGIGFGVITSYVLMSLVETDYI